MGYLLSFRNGIKPYEIIIYQLVKINEMEISTLNVIGIGDGGEIQQIILSNSKLINNNKNNNSMKTKTKKKNKKVNRLHNGKKSFVCCISETPSNGYGNNPSPIIEDGRCCDVCNSLFVIPFRIRLMLERKLDNKQ